MGLSGRKINDRMVLFGDPLSEKALQALQMQRGAAIDNEIVKITEQMVGEEAEAMQKRLMFCRNRVRIKMFRYR